MPYKLDWITASIKYLSNVRLLFGERGLRKTISISLSYRNPTNQKHLGLCFSEGGRTTLTSLSYQWPINAGNWLSRNSNKFPSIVLPRSN